MDDSERDALILMLITATRFDATARALLDMAWVANGLTDTEAGFIRSLVVIDHQSAAIAERVLSLPWVADGISDIEAFATSYLSVISWTDADAALQVMGMPFLQTLEYVDVAALNRLSLLSDHLTDILSRPMLKDGISDDDLPIVSMLGLDLDFNDKLLDPDVTTVERRTVDLSLAGEVDLAIVRTRPGARRGMDLLENAVRESENLMGSRFPSNYVGLLYKGSGTGGDGSTDGRFTIEISPKYDADDSRWGRLTIAHEVAHFYWFWSAGWIDEGMAQLMASAIENRRVGTPIGFTYGGPCGFARSIKELEALPHEQYGACMYYLGERLFVSLLRTLGEDAFWEGARNLYAASLNIAASDGTWAGIQDVWAGTQEVWAGIEEVRQAFGPNASNVIERWYEGR